MKNICQLALVLALGFQVIGCGKNNNGSGGSTTALAPTSFQSCEPGAQTNYGQAGYAGQNYGYIGSSSQHRNFSPYQWGNNYNNVSQQGFCGCNYGEVPACSPGVGLQCVPSQGISNYAQYNYGGGGYSFGGFSQSSAGLCPTSIGQICQAGVVNSCGAYGQCVQTPSGYGICAQ